jgi:hypothetical protein
MNGKPDPVPFNDYGPIAMQGLWELMYWCLVLQGRKLDYRDCYDRLVTKCCIIFNAQIHSTVWRAV